MSILTARDSQEMARLASQHMVQQRPLLVKVLQLLLEKQAFVTAGGRPSCTNQILDFHCRENLPLGIILQLRSAQLSVTSCINIVDATDQLLQATQKSSDTFVHTPAVQLPFFDSPTSLMPSLCWILLVRV